MRTTMSSRSRGLTRPLLARALAVGLLAGSVASAAPAAAGSVGRHPRAVPIGTYAVGMISPTFVDPSRPTAPNGSFPGASSRTLLTAIYYPARGTPSDKPVANAPFEASHGPYPLILFSHGVLARGVFYEGVLKKWASAGYVVAAPDYPLSNTNAPGGVTFGGGVSDVKNQPADASFVISQVLKLDKTEHLVGGTVDQTRIGASGHSLGGITTYGLVYSACCSDKRIRAAVPMSGFAGIVDGADRYFGGLKVPLLTLHGNADPIVPYQVDIEGFARARSPKFLVTFLGGGHISPFLGGDDPAAVALERATVDFWDRYLKGDNAALGQLRADASVTGVTAFQQDPGRRSP
jgi:predicted dienelactone hydrolase